MLNIFHIKYKGITKSYDVIDHGWKPDNAVCFDEESSEKQVTKKSYLVSMPIWLPILLLGFYKFLSLNRISDSDSIVKILFIDVLAILPFFTLTFLHELIHCLCFPKQAVKEIWIKTKGVFCLITYCNYPVSKVRFILINAAPNLLLGMFPFLLWMLGVFDFSITFSRAIGFVILVLIMGGVWDFYNIYLTMKKVPAKAKVILYKDEFYWFYENAQPHPGSCENP